MSAVCSSVESCLQLGEGGGLLIDLIFLFSDSFIFAGLRRRSLGLFKTNYSSALLGKISKECNDAALVVKR